MDIDLRLQAWQREAVAYLQNLSPDQLYNLWIGAGVVLFVFLAWLSHHIMRKALGHVQFRGTWYNPEQFEELLQMIDEDNRRGHRVMRRDEMLLLRKALGVRLRGISDNAKGYF